MSEDPKQAVRWDEETDVIVIGGGLAGHCAALEAASNGSGSRVLLLEKQPEVGGTSSMSGGFFAFAGTDQQIAQGIEDSDEIFFQDLMDVGGHENDPEVVRAFVEHQLDVYRWLGGLGIPFSAAAPSSGQSVPRTHPTNSKEMIQILGAHADDHPSIERRTSTAVRRLLRSGVEGRVEGVQVEQEGRTTAIRARRGVVLASGGFTHDVGLLKMFVPRMANVQRIGGAGNVGDGLRMAWRLGAGVRDTAHVKATFGNHPSAGSDKHLLHFPIYRGAIAVNKLGRRFVDESISYKLLGDACLEQPDSFAYQIFDRPIMDRSEPGVLTFDFEEALERGLIFEAPTLVELAAKADLDPDVLQATVDEYNRYVAQGKDEAFGRSGLSSGFGALVPIGVAPFYAYPSTNLVLGTYCGISVDADTRVVDVFGDSIEGLYAAGEVTGGFHGVAYMTGSGLSKAAVFGRLAGRLASTQTP